MKLLVVLTTEANQAKAEALAAQLLEQRLAACIALQPQQSLYHWQGRIEKDSEVQLVIKTNTERLEALEIALHQLHSYDVPEWIVLSGECSEAYGSWLSSCRLGGSRDAGHRAEVHLHAKLVLDGLSFKLVELVEELIFALLSHGRKHVGDLLPVSLRLGHIVLQIRQVIRIDALLHLLCHFIAVFETLNDVLVRHRRLDRHLLLLQHHLLTVELGDLTFIHFHLLQSQCGTTNITGFLFGERLRF